jgi:hypothetical protein
MNIAGWVKFLQPQKSTKNRNNYHLLVVCSEFRYKEVALNEKLVQSMQAYSAMKMSNRSKRANKAMARKSRILLLVIIAGVVLLSLLLFIANINSPPSSLRP